MATKVFIGSTSSDLGEYRQAAIEICNQFKMVPIAMEFFEAMGAGATKGCKHKIDDAELYVGIFAHRYGYIEDGYEKSVTEIEFDYAGNRSIGRLCFLVDLSHPWPPEAIDFKQYDKLEAFKEKINKSLIRAQFTTVDDFRAKLMIALVKWQKRNLKKGDKVQAEDPMVNAPFPVSVPPVPSLIVGREADLDNVKHRLGINNSDTRKPLTIIRGWPGVGKTTLVTTLAYNQEVINTFPDGVLWASVGDNPNPFHELVNWGRALGVDISQAKRLEDAMAQVRSVLSTKSALLIVDDIWETDSATPFRIAGPDCATLVTTRFVGVSRELATTPDDVYLLDKLDDEQGVDLLTRLAPNVVEQYPDESRKLVSDLEGLPLALRVAGRLLESDASAGFDIIDSFKILSEESELLKAKAPDDRFDPRTGTTPTVELLLQKSTDRLDEQTRDCFAYLGAFAPKPATFDLEAMRAVWTVDDPKPIARTLVDRGLLEPLPSLGHFWMHAVLVMHANSMLEDDETSNEN